MTPTSVPSQCSSKRASAARLGLVAILVGLPEALGRGLRHQQQQPFPQMPATSMLAFGGYAINPMTQEELESLPNPGDVTNAALGASSVDTLSMSLQGPGMEAPPPLVEDASTIDYSDAPAPDDDNTNIEDGTTNGLTDPALQNMGTIDMMARATSDVDRQTASIRATKPAKSPPLVSMVVCAKAAQQLKAMSCSLVTQISGFPEGCECRMKAKKCPAVRRDLGFTGVSPSIPFSPPQLGGQSVILCMYWQWLKPQDRSKEDKQVAEETKEMTINLVKAAHLNAEAGAKIIATNYYAMTPAPVLVTTTMMIPATPAPIMEPIRFFSTTPYNPYAGFSTTYNPYGRMAPAPAPMGFYSAGVTGLSAWATAGQITLEVPSIVGFMIGSRIQIGNEFNVIKAFSSIILAYPLKFNHAVGEVVKVVLTGPGPAPGPSPGPAPFAAFGIMPMAPGFAMAPGPAPGGVPAPAPAR